MTLKWGNALDAFKKYVETVTNTTIPDYTVPKGTGGTVDNGSNGSNNGGNGGGGGPVIAGFT